MSTGISTIMSMSVYDEYAYAYAYAYEYEYEYEYEYANAYEYEYEYEYAYAYGYIRVCTVYTGVDIYRCACIQVWVYAGVSA